MAVKNTPLIAQYLRVKEKVPDAILLFRLGDFYEMFFEDAELASSLLDIQLTSRSKDGVPLCGVPHHAAEPYIAKLLKAGHKVAICEQEGDASSGRGLIPRRIVRIITPGTVDEELILSADEKSFLVALVAAEDGFGLAAVDVSTGEFRIARERDRRILQEEISRLEPREIVYYATQETLSEILVDTGLSCPRTAVKEDQPDDAQARRILAQYFGADFSLDEPLLRSACVLALTYIERTFGNQLAHLRPPAIHHSERYMMVDEVSRRHLELTVSTEGTKAGSLLGVLDQSLTPMGGRTLHDWLLHPLLNLAEINRRLDAVEELVAADLGGEVSRAMRAIGDLERIASRVATLRAGPRELVKLAHGLAALDEVKRALGAYSSELICDIAQRIKPQAELVSLITSALCDDAPQTARDGGFIRPGFDARVDELRSLAHNAREVLANLEARERERTGIGSLKVRYNRVFGYYIEVTRPHLARIPSDYERKQTLVGSERFTTPELKELERKILSAETGLEQLELELFNRLLRQAAAHATEIQESAAAVGEFDALVSLALVARKNNYVRPVLDSSSAILLREARHPVLETLMRPGEFVPNDLELDPDRHQLLLITGPNMAGKSTYLRQTALIVIMAQVGSFVPAAEARLGLVDRVATRIGARDDLRRGQSTFMVEMQETARLLEGLSERSLLLLDEVGRGTSTYDGLAIAWALAEHLHDRTRAKVLFATHFHELTALCRHLPRVKNMCAVVREWNGEVIFLRRIAEGVADRSYGIEVARLAGLPQSLLTRAREILNSLERGELFGVPVAYAKKRRREDKTVGPQMQQMSLFGVARSTILERLRKIEIDRITPLDALSILAELVEQAKREPDCGA